jgi:hypothetical protein
MLKKIKIKMPEDKDAWVKEGRDNFSVPKEDKNKDKVKRLTVDIPEELHRKFKVYCIEKGVNMADVIREMIEERI